MPKHSVSEAARLAGVSRSHFYKKFIKTGLISVERDKDGKPVIDTAEIMRACGTLQAGLSPNTQNGQVDTSEKHIQNTALQVEIQLLREQLAAAADREKWLQGKVDQLTNQLDTTTRLLEHRPADPDTAKLQGEVNMLKKEMNFARKEMSWWGRLLGRKTTEL